MQITPATARLHRAQVGRHRVRAGATSRRRRSTSPTAPGTCATCSTATTATRRSAVAAYNAGDGNVDSGSRDARRRGSFDARATSRSRRRAPTSRTCWSTASSTATLRARARALGRGCGRRRSSQRRGGVRDGLLRRGMTSARGLAALWGRPGSRATSSSSSAPSAFSARSTSRSRAASPRRELLDAPPRRRLPPGFAAAAPSFLALGARSPARSPQPRRRSPRRSSRSPLLRHPARCPRAVA